jgi:hypothetical protein
MTSVILDEIISPIPCRDYEFLLATVFLFNSEEKLLSLQP